MSDLAGNKGPKTRDYLAELFVAGIMGDAKWQIYFPKRDEGFDFIAVKRTSTGTVVRPVQVKGLYPTAEKKDRAVYQWRGKLTQTHADMIVAFCYFSVDPTSVSPTCVAYVPLAVLKQPSRGGYRFGGASLKGGRVSPRRDSKHLFDWDGLRALDGRGVTP
jgi:hypothetical protein